MINISKMFGSKTKNVGYVTPNHLPVVQDVHLNCFPCKKTTTLILILFNVDKVEHMRLSGEHVFGLTIPVQTNRNMVNSCLSICNFLRTLFLEIDIEHPRLVFIGKNKLLFSVRAVFESG